LAIPEQPGAFRHDIHTLPLPGQLSRIFDGGDYDFPAIDNDTIVLNRHLRIESAVNRIVLQQMGDGHRIHKVIYGDHFKIISAQRRPEKETADSTEPIDSYVGFH
jgi:hypothetical protein